MSRGRQAHGLAAALLAAACLLISTTLPATATGAAATGGIGRTSGIRASTPPAAGAPGAERAAIGAGSLAVLISGFEPAIPTAGSVLTIRGTVTNTSARPVGEVSVALRLSSTPLPSRGEIPEILAGAGTRVGFPVPGVADTVAGELAAGAMAEFALSVPVDDLGLAAPGVYVTGVEALGSTGAGVVRQDLDRTFLPWWPSGTAVQPLLLTTLWPLVGAPLRDATGTLLSEDPAVEMSPAGRLATLVEAAAVQPGAISLVVDPQVVEAAADMADGYEVRAGEGSAPGTRSTEVARFLADLQAAVAQPGADAAGMLYSQPDLVAAQRGRLLGALLGQRAAIDATTATVLGRSLPAELAVVPGGAADESTLAALAAGQVPVTVLSDQSVVLTTPTYFTASGSVVLPTSDGDLAVLVTDSGLADALAMPMSTPADLTAARQRLLAETLVTVTELPETQRLLVGMPEPQWSPPAEGARMVVDTVASAPWVSPTTIPDALAREPSTLPRTLAEYGPDEVALEIPAGQVAQVRAQVRGLRDYAAVLTDPASLPPSTATTPSRGVAAWFRGDPTAGAELVGVVDRQVAAALGSVRVVSSGSITVSGTSGTIPVTVENLGTAPITVGLTMSSTPPQLFSADPVPPFQIEPQRRTSVEVVAQVAAAGPIPVTIQLTTSDGAPFGEPGELTVSSSAYANAARILVRVALGALLLAVVVHGIRRARRRRRAHPVAAEHRTPSQSGVRGA